MTTTPENHKAPSKSRKGYSRILQSDLAGMHEPIEPTQIQKAYLMGRRPDFQLGGFGTHGVQIYETRFDMDRLGLALQEMIARHPMLRAHFDTLGRLCISDRVPHYDFLVEDLTALAAEDREARLEAEKQRLVDFVFEPTQWPLFEFKAFKVAPGVHHLYCNLDLLLADGAGIKIFQDEWLHFYLHPDQPLPPLEINFRDYLVEYHRLRESDRYHKARDYWRERAKTLPEAPQLALAKDTAEITGRHFERCEVELSRETADVIKARAKDLRVSLSVLLATAYAEVLAYWSNQPQLAVNFTVFNRYPFHHQVNQLIGDFTSIVLVDFDMAADKSFADAAKTANRAMLRALRHRYYEGVEVIRDLALARDTGARPAYPIVFTSMIGEETDEQPVSFGKRLFGHSRTPQVLLDCQVANVGGRLQIIWDYQAEAFDPQTIHEMFDHFKFRLHHLEQDQPIPLGLPPRHQRFIESYNRTEDPAIQVRPLHHLVMEQARKTPLAIAVKSESDALDYRDLIARANQVANSLRDRGIGRGDFVAVLGDRHIQSIVNVLGVLISGAAYVPIDPDYPEERRDIILSNSESRLLLTRHTFAEENMGAQSTADPGVASHVDDLAYIIYTSGSTGRPKGVVLRHGAAANTVIDINRRFGVEPSDRVAGISSLGFDLSVWDVFGTLSAGATLVLVPTPKDFKLLASVLQREAITIWNSVPAILDMMLEDMGPDFHLDSPRLALLSGDWIPLRLHASATRAFPNLKLISLGGATEGAIWSIHFPIERVEPQWRSIPYGYPLANQTFHVLNQRLEHCPVNVEGELYIGGVGVASGYRNDPEKTANAFIHHPTLGDVYKTGDFGVWRDAGYIEFLGRRDFQVKIRGYRIELGEIESVVMEHDDVANAAVVDRLDANGKKYLAAYIVGSKAIPDSEMRAFLSVKLPDYMIPTSYVAVDEIPLTANGKVDKKALPEPGAPAVKETHYVPPTTAMERRVAALWRQVLGFERVGIHDNFFDLGGDSLKIQQVINLIESDLGVRIPIAELFKKQTIADLSEYLLVETGSVTEHQVDTDPEPVNRLLDPHQVFALQKDLFVDDRDDSIFYDPQSYRRFKREARDRKPPAGDRVISLASGEWPEQLDQRQSIRVFKTNQPIPLATLASFLGVLGRRQHGDREVYGYASAGGLYPLDLFLHVKKGRVESLDEGVYAYHPPTNSLHRVSPGRGFAGDIHFIRNRRIFQTSALSLFVVYNAAVNMPVYNSDGYLYACIEAGMILQLLSMTGAAHGLGLCSIGELNFEAVRDQFNLTEHQTLIHSLEVGYPCTESGQDYEELPETLVAHLERRAEFYELSGAQQRLYALCSRYPDSIVYNGPMANMITGAFDQARFEAVIQTIFRRHEAFSTCFRLHQGSPVQFIQEGAQLEIQYLEADEASLQGTLFSLIRPFDLAQAPLFRVAVIRLDATRRVLFTDCHHIIADMSSGAVMLAEMARLFQGGKLDPIRMEFREYARLQNQRIHSREMREQERYWLDVYREPPAPLDMPTDFPRPASPSFAGARVHHQISAELTAQIHRRASEEGVTLFMVLLGAWQTLLARYSGVEDIVSGSPIAGRGSRDVENVVGMFANTLTFRNQPKGDLTFAQLLSQVRQGAVGAFSHQDYPFDLLVDQLALPHDSSRNPLFENMLVLQNMAMPELRTDHFNIQPFEFETGVTKFDLTMEVRERDGVGHFQLEYASDLYKPETAARLVRHFELLLDRLSAQPQQPLREISLLDGAERERVLHQFNDTAAAYDHARTIIDLLTDQVGKTPDAPALDSPTAVYTFREFAAMVQTLAHQLVAVGVQPGQTVAICPQHREEAVVAFYGIIMAGGVYLPLDPKLPDARLHYMLAQAGAVLVLGELDAAVLPEGVTAMAMPPEPLSAAQGMRAVARAASNAAYVIFTSGSTGKPKGVLVPHQGIVNLREVYARDWNIGPEDAVLQFSNPTFDVSIFDFTMSMLTGAALHVPAPEVMGDYRLFENFVNDHGVTVMTLPPPFARHLNPDRIHTLRLLITGGSATDRELVNAWRDKVTYYNCYGPTETTIITTLGNLSEAPVDAPVTIGKPHQNARMYIMDVHGQGAPVGVPGELCIAGDNLALGYVGQPELTARAFVPHPLEPGGLIYRSGDLARWTPEGELIFMGRKDKQVKIRGFRIEPGEIQAVLADSPSVVDAIVLPLQDAAGENYLCAWVAPGPGYCEASARERLGQQLPEYMVPPFIVAVDQFPINNSGKVDTARLPHPGVCSQTITRPTDPTGSRLAAMWAEVLKVPVEEIGQESHFFHLGGHSLRATRLISHIYQGFGVELRLPMLFENPVLAQQIRLIEGGISTAYQPIPTDVRGSEFPLSRQQENFFMLAQSDPHALSFNSPMTVTLSGTLDRDRLKQTFQMMISRLAVLRTSFHLTESGVVQRIHEQVPFDVTFIDHPPADLKACLESLIKPFDLERAPLIRVAVVCLSEQEHSLFVDMHHIITDGASQVHFLKEFAAAYAGETLPEPAVAYHHFATWQQRRLSEGGLADAQAWWLEHLGGDLPVLDLPLDSPRPQLWDTRGDTVFFQVDPRRMAKIKAQLEASGATLYMFLLAVYKICLAKSARQEDIIIGSPIAGRYHPDVENASGLFIDNIALRSQPQMDKTFEAYLQEVRGTTLAAYQYQDYPFKSLVEKLGVKAKPGRSPLFDCALILHNFEFEDVVLPDLTLSQFEHVTRYAKLDLTFDAVEVDDHLDVKLDYAVALFNRESIETLSRAYLNMIDAVCDNPDVRLGDLVLNDDPGGKPAKPFSCYLMGESSLLTRCGELALRRGHKVLGVISNEPETLAWSQLQGIPVTEVKRESIAAFLAREPFDYLFSINNGLILKDELNYPQKGTINYHDSLLPKYAGVYATSWALINDETAHGITWHLAEKDVDSGDILKQIQVPVEAGETVASLNTKCFQAAYQGFRTLISQLAAGSIAPVKQETDQQTWYGYHKRPRAAALLDFHQDGEDLDRLLRALYFGPYDNFLAAPKLAHGKHLSLVLRASLTDAAPSVQPATLFKADNQNLVIGTSSRPLRIEELARLDGTPLSIENWLRETGLTVGDRLAPPTFDRSDLTVLNGELAKHEDFWRSRLSYLEPAVLAHRGGDVGLSAPERCRRVTLELPAKLRHRHNVHALVATAFCAYMYRILDQPRFDMGYLHPGLSRILGGLSSLASDVVPLHVVLPPQLSLDESVRRFNREIDRLEQRHTFLWDIFARFPQLAQRRDDFRIASSLTLAKGFSQAQIERMGSRQLTLALPMDESSITFIYNTDVFTQDSIRYLIEAFLPFVRRAAKAPKEPLSEHELLSDTQRTEILHNFNQTQHPITETALTYRRIEATAARFPHNTAVVAQGQALTYRELDQKANALAHRLMEHGVACETVVAILAGRSLERIVALLAVQKAGGAYLPIDPDYPDHRKIHLLTDSGAALLLTDQLQMAPEAYGGAILDLTQAESYGTDLSSPEVMVDSNALAYLIYTSGSSGKPKGVAVEQGNLSAYMKAFDREFHLGPEDRVLQQASFSFDAFVEEMYPTLIAGGALYLIDKEELLNPESFIAFLNEHGITLISCAPILLSILNQQAERVRGVRVFISGGDVLKKSYVNHLMEQALVYNTYGPTETTVCATYHRCQPDDHEMVPIGKPIANYHTYVMDSRLKLKPVGVAGELCIGGPGVARGYWGQPELTAEKFIVNPYRDERLYRTGDLVRLRPDGSLDFFGRKDNQISIRGFRIEPGEIEKALASLDAVDEAIVVMRRPGGGEAALCAYFTGDPAVTVKKLRSDLADLFPEYMIPKFFTHLPRLPITIHGKIDTRALPEPGGLGTGKAWIGAENENEESMMAIWREVLGVEEISTADNFFELGGDSIKVISLISRIHQELGVRLTMQDVFSSHSLQALTQKVSSGSGSSAYEVIPKLAAADHYELSYAQRRMWILYQKNPTSSAFNLPGLLTIDHAIEEAHFIAVLNHLKQRHESFRTSFTVVANQPVQVIGDDTPLDYEFIDLSQDDNAQTLRRKIYSDFIAKPFDLSRPPLVRARLVKVAEAEYDCMFCMHHIVSDGTSTDILRREMAAAYQAIKRGSEPDLPGLTIQYKDFAAWQNRLLHDEDKMKRAKDFWERKLGRDLPEMVLPYDFNVGQVENRPAAQYRAVIGPDLQKKLKRLALDLKVSPAMVLMTGFDILLAKLSVRKNVMYGIASAGRDDDRLRGIVGFFVNTIILHNRVDPDQNFRDLVAEIGKDTLEALEYQNYPLELIFDALNLKYPDLSVFFNMLNIFGELSELKDFEAGHLTAARQTKFDITMYISEFSNAIEVKCEYFTGRFKPETIAFITSEYIALLELIVQDPDKPVKDYKRERSQAKKKLGKGRKLIKRG